VAPEDAGFDPDITTEELLEQGDRLTASSKALISDIDELLGRSRRPPIDLTESTEERENRPGLGRRSSDADRR
jgi:hypothetical protein